MGQLDITKDILATILNSLHERIVEEKQLFERYGFVQSGTAIEAGVDVLVMQYRQRRG